MAGTTEKIKMLYKYNDEYQTLQQWDEDGILRASMSMSKEDLWKISKLSFNEKTIKILDLKEKFDV